MISPAASVTLLPLPAGCAQISGAADHREEKKTAAIVRAVSCLTPANLVCLGLLVTLLPFLFLSVYNIFPWYCSWGSTMNRAPCQQTGALSPWRKTFLFLRYHSHAARSRLWTARLSFVTRKTTVSVGTGHCSDRA